LGTEHIANPANKRGLPFVKIAGKILVKRAISNSKKNNK
jgi:hypothetical protein